MLGALRCAGEYPSVEDFGLRLRFCGVRVVQAITQPLVSLDRFPATAEAGEHIDQHSVQLLVEGMLRCERFKQGKSSFQLPLLRQLRSEQRRYCRMGFGESFTIPDHPVGVPILR
jgi:hypothetical protein